MNIKTININDLRNLKGREGLIIQGCGGDAKEWVDGINDVLTKECILLNGTKFDYEDCYVFEDGDHTSILFEFNDKQEMNIGKFAMWRIESHDTFYGTWLTDFVDNKLGGFKENEVQKQKPDCPLIGQDGNIFNLMGIASKTLRQNGLPEQAKEMTERITNFADNYYEALVIISDYVNVTSADDCDCDIEEDMDLELN